MFLALLLGSSALYAQFKWVNLTTLSGDLPNGRVGLTALNGKLIMTWGAQGSNELMFSTSTDGIHWTAPQGLNGTVREDGASQSGPLISQNGPPYASGGVNMTTSPVCNAAYVAWTGPDGDEIYVATTKDGQNWTYAGPLVNVPSPSGYTSPGTSSPALYGGNSQPIIQFAYPVPYGMVDQPDGDGGVAGTESYKIEVGQFNCDLSGVQLEGGNSCFFWDSGNNTCQDNDDSYYPNAYEWDGGYVQTLTPSGPWSPLWGGSGGVEVKAIFQGSPLNNAEPPTYFSIDGGPYGSSGALECLSAPGNGCPPTSFYQDAAHWGNNGGTVTVVPASGTPLLARTCAPVESDPNDHHCRGANGLPGGNKGEEPVLQVYDLANGLDGPSIANWSPVAPASVYFDNQIWYAMCAGYSCEGGVTVGSVYPAQLTGCTYTAPDIYVPGSATAATGTVDVYGGNGGCIWGAFSGAAWPWPALAAHGNGNGTYAFPVTQNDYGYPIQYSLTAADDKTVAVYQGTADGSPGTGWVRIQSNRQRQTEPNSGVISVMINGVTFPVGYSWPGDTADELAAALASEINSQPPDSAFSASPSGAYVYISSNLNGADTDYSLSTSLTYSEYGPAFSPAASGTALAGGAD